MTAGEWMTVGEGTGTWVPEMSPHLETLDVSDFQTGLQSSYPLTVNTVCGTWVTNTCFPAKQYYKAVQ